MRGDVRTALPGLSQVEVDDVGASAPKYQAERLTESELRRMLGFETRYELNGFLKERGVFLAYTMEDVRREFADIEAFRGA